MKVRKVKHLLVENFEQLVAVVCGLRQTCIDDINNVDTQVS